MQSKVQKDWIKIGKLGRTIGFKGEVFFYSFSDFPEFLRKGGIYLSRFGELRLEYHNIKSSVVKFYGIDSKETAEQLVNLVLYTTKEQSKKQCKLKEDEFFWFEIVGSEIVENGEVLGIVSEISRFCGQDFLCVDTSLELINQKLPKSFLIPYTSRYIVNVESINDFRVIHTQFCKEILENS